VSPYQHRPPAPAPEMDQMLEEIERGYVDPLPPT
jgi:hypothetical protein